MKQILVYFSFFLYSQLSYAQEDSLKIHPWLRHKISFGRSQHIQYWSTYQPNRTSTLFNKSYYTSFMPINIKGFKPLISLHYEYFITKAPCFTCIEITPDQTNKKFLHFINYASTAIGFTQELKWTTRNGKSIEIIVGARLHRFLFKQAFIYSNEALVSKTKPFTTSHPFFKSYFFNDLFGVRVFNSNQYKVYIQLSGLLLRNDRLYYPPSRHIFHNFMLGFQVFI